MKRKDANLVCVKRRHGSYDSMRHAARVVLQEQLAAACCMPLLLLLVAAVARG